MAVMLPRLLGAVVGLLVAGMATASHATTVTYDTTPSWNGGSASGSFQGGFDSRGVGQTFITPTTHNILENFTLFISNSGSVSMTAYVMEWDGDSPTGSILFQSATQTRTQVGDVLPVTFDTNSLALNVSLEYVFFLDLGDGPASFPINVGRVDEAFFLGRMVTSGIGSSDSFSLLSTIPWINVLSGSDAAFTATFSSAIPLPAAFPLFATALAGMGLLGWRRKRKAAV